MLIVTKKLIAVDTTKEIQLEKNEINLRLERFVEILKKEFIQNLFMPYVLNSKQPDWENEFSTFNEVKGKVFKGLTGLGITPTGGICALDFDTVAGRKFLKKLGIDVDNPEVLRKLIGWSSGSYLKGCKPFDAKDKFDKDTRLTLIVKETPIFTELFKRAETCKVEIEGVEISSGHGGQVQIPTHSKHPETNKPYFFINDLTGIETIPVVPNEDVLREAIEKYFESQKKSKANPEAIDRRKERYKEYLDGKLRVEDLYLNELQQFVYNPILAKLTGNDIKELTDHRHKFDDRLYGDAFYRESSSGKSFQFYQEDCKVTGQIIWLWHDWNSKGLPIAGGDLFSYQKVIIDKKRKDKNFNKDHLKYLRYFADVISERLKIDLYCPQKGVYQEIDIDEVKSKDLEVKEIESDYFHNLVWIDRQLLTAENTIYKVITKHDDTNQDKLKTLKTIWSCNPKQYILDSSVVGIGKTDLALRLRPYNFDLKFIRYATSNYLNVHGRDWLTAVTRNRGIVKEKGELRIVQRGEKPKVLEVEATCLNMPLIDLLRDNNISIGDCKKICPFAESCTYQQTKTINNEEELLIIHTSMISPKEETNPNFQNSANTLLILDETVNFTQSETLTISQYEKYTKEVIKHLDKEGYDRSHIIETVFKMISEKWVAYLDLPKNSFNHGLEPRDFYYNMEFTIPECLEYLTLQPLEELFSLSGKDTEGLSGFELEDKINKNLTKSNKISQIFKMVDILKIVNGTATKGSLSVNKEGNLVITKPNKNLIDGIKSAGKALFLNATANIKIKLTALDIPVNNLTIICDELQKAKIKKIQIVDCKEMGRVRSTSQDHIKNDLINWYRNQGIDTAVIDFKSKTDPYDPDQGYWGRDNVATNKFKDKKCLIIVGHMIPNLIQAAAEFKTIFGYVPNTDYEKRTIKKKQGKKTFNFNVIVNKDKAWHNFIDHYKWESTTQAIGRLRAILRMLNNPKLELTVVFLSNYHHSHGDDIEFKTFFEHTGIVRNKRVIRILKVLDILQDFLERGITKTTFYELSQIVGSDKLTIHKDIVALFGGDFPTITDANKELIQTIKKTYRELSRGLFESHSSYIAKTNRKQKRKVKVTPKPKPIKPINQNSAINQQMPTDNSILPIERIRESVTIRNNYLSINTKRINLEDIKPYIPQNPKVREYLEKNITRLSLKGIQRGFEDMIRIFSPNTLKEAIPDTFYKPLGEEGGFTESFTSGGFHKNVSSIDFDSFYPTILTLYSITSHKDKDNILLEIVSQLLDLRQKETDPIKNKLYKDFVNRISGYLKTPSALFNDQVAYNLMTGISREYAQKAIAIIEKLGGEVLTAVTDGIKFKDADPILVQQTLAEKIPLFPTKFEFKDCDIYFETTKKNKANRNSFLVLNNGVIILSKGTFNSKNQEIKKTAISLYKLVSAGNISTAKELFSKLDSQKDFIQYFDNLCNDFNLNSLKPNAS